jgi:ferritin
MLIKPELAKKMNEQILNEFSAAIEYLAIANYFKKESLDKTADFFYKQAEEEKEHAMKFLHYVMETGGTVELPTIPAPKIVVRSAEQAFQAALDWETEVTSQVYALMELAKTQKDYMAENFLMWFVEEQLEEVTTMEKYLAMAQKLGEQRVFMLENFIERSEG